MKKIGMLLAGIAGLIALFRYFNVQEVLTQILDWISGLGFLGVGIYFVIYVLATVLLIPGSILTFGAGAIYGVIWGSVIVSVTSTMAGTAAFLVGRTFARKWVAKKIESNKKFKAIDDAVAKEGWKIVGLTRLSPVFPFNLQNYAYSITQVSLRDYFWASWVGMLPATIMFVYIGSLGAELATLGAEGREKTALEWGLYVVGLVATAAVTVYVTRIAKKALHQKVSEV